MSENTKNLIATDNPGVFNASEDCAPITTFSEFRDKLRKSLEIIKKEYNDECPAPWNADTISNVIRVLLTRVLDIGKIIFNVEDAHNTIDDVRYAAFFVTDLDADTEEESYTKDICAIVTVKHPYTITENSHFAPVYMCTGKKDISSSSIVTSLLDAAVIHNWDNAIVIDLMTSLFVNKSITILPPKECASIVGFFMLLELIKL